MLKPLPEVQATPYKQFFIDQGITVGQVASYLNLSYAYTAHLLNADIRITPQNKQKLDDLVHQLGGNDGR